MKEDSIGLFWVETISLPESTALPRFIVVVCDLVKSPTELSQTLTSMNAHDVQSGTLSFLQRHHQEINYFCERKGIKVTPKLMMSFQDWELSQIS